MAYHFVEGRSVSNAKTFAGYGGVKPLQKDTLDGLCEQFPGSSREKWAHRKGIAYLDIDGEEGKGRGSLVPRRKRWKGEIQGQTVH